MFLAFDVDALVAAGEMTVASGKLTLSVEDLLANVIEGYLFRDLLSLWRKSNQSQLGPAATR